MEKGEVEKMSVLDLSKWLEDSGIPGTYCELFEDNEIDGEAFCEISEEDVKAIIKPLGIVKKIIRLQRTIIQPKSTAPDHGDVQTTPSSSSCSSIVVVPSSSESIPISSHTLTIPSKWKPSITCAISEKKLCLDIRNEIVRDLVTHLYGQIERPDTKTVSKMAKLVVERYPFMADSPRSGSTIYGSWEKKIMDRVYNVEKGHKRLASASVDDRPKKRGHQKQVINLSSRYPPLQLQKNTAQDEHIEAIAKEMEKEKPRKDIVLPLMKSTFYERRQYILDSDDAVLTKLDKFPPLKMPAILEQELELILCKQSLQRAFNTEWMQKWVPAILTYSKSLKRKDVKDILKEMDKCDDGL